MGGILVIASCATFHRVFSRNRDHPIEPLYYCDDNRDAIVSISSYFNRGYFMKTLMIALLMLVFPASAFAKDLTTTTSINDHSILRNGDYAWVSDPSMQKVTHIQVNLATQMAYVYAGDTLLAVTNISSGRSGFDTPTGSFTILGKEDHHWSKKYKADMPWTMWLNNDGVALHAGITPGYRSSHGCVHLPLEFAQILFPLVDRSTSVDINREDSSRLVIADY